MLKKLKNLSKGKKIALLILICILVFGIIIVAGLGNDVNQTNQLEEIILPDDFKDDVLISKSGSNSPISLKSYSNSDEMKSKGSVGLNVEFYDNNGYENSTESTDDPIFHYQYGYWEVVDIDGQNYLVSIHNTDLAYHDSSFNKYCLDNLHKFNELNDVTVIEP